MILPDITIEQLNKGWFKWKSVIRATKKEALKQQNLILQQLTEIESHHIEKIHKTRIKRIQRQFVVYEEQSISTIKKINIRKIKFFYLYQKYKKACKYAHKSQKLNDKLKKLEEQRNSCEQCILRIQQNLDLRVQTDNENHQVYMSRHDLRNKLESIFNSQPQLMMVVEEIFEYPDSILNKLGEFIIKVFSNMSEILKNFKETTSINQIWEYIKRQIDITEKFNSIFGIQQNWFKLEDVMCNNLLIEKQKLSSVRRSIQFVKSIPVLADRLEYQGGKIADDLDIRVAQIYQQMQIYLKKQSILPIQQLSAIEQIEEQLRENYNVSSSSDLMSYQQGLDSFIILQLNHQMNNLNIQFHDEQQMSEEFEENEEK